MNCLAGWYAYENVSNFCVRKNSDNYNELAHMIKDSNDRKNYISLKKNEMERVTWKTHYLAF
jgi:hypothetical protein